MKKKRRLHRTFVQESPDIFDYEQLHKCLNDFLELTLALQFFVIRYVETTANISERLKEDIIRLQENPDDFDEEEKRLINAFAKDRAQKWDASLYDPETDQKYMSRWVWGILAYDGGENINEHLLGAQNVMLALDDFVHEHRTILESHAFGVFAKEAFVEIRMTAGESNRRKNRGSQKSGYNESEIARGLFRDLIFVQFESEIREFLNLHATYSMKQDARAWEDFEPVNSSIVDKYPDCFLTYRLAEGI